MDDKNDKFIIGDNTDGYRRSASDYDLDLFAERKKPAEEPKREPQGRPVRAQQKAPAKKNGAKVPNFFTRKPSQPVPEKKGPTVKRHGKPPSPQETRRIPRPVKRPAPVQEEKILSANERRRLHAEQRRAERRRKTILQYIAIGFAVVAVMVVLSLTVFFKIDEIQIVGESPYTDEQIIASSGISLNENIIVCDAKGVSGKLAKALPHIGSAEVKRSLSGKVTITVKVTPGKYSFINGDTAVVINDEGKVLGQVPAAEAVKYTVVQGLGIVNAVPGETVEVSDSGAYELLKSVGAQLDGAGINKITSVDITNVYDINVVYDGRLTLLIGGMSSVERKLALAAKVIERENEIDPMQYGRIDLSSVEGKAFFKPLEEPVEEETSEETSVPVEETSQQENQPEEEITEVAE